MLDTDEPGGLFASRGGEPCTEPTVVPLEIVQAASGLVTEETEGLHLLRGELTRPFQKQHARGVAADANRQRKEIRDSLLTRECLVIACHGRAGAGARKDQFFILIERFVHGLLESPGERHFLVELLRVADRLETEILPLEPAEAHPLATETCREFIAHLHRGCDIVSLRV
jgi:hypothetical protein